MKQADAEVGIIGAGPGGSTAALHLAARGVSTLVFDHSHPREKVCGGGLSSMAVTMFPELAELRASGRSGTILRVLSPAGRLYEVGGGGNTFAVDRAVLDEFLLKRAVAAGATHVREKVRDLSKHDNGWRIDTTRGKYFVSQIIGADGANSLTRRKLIGPIPKKHLAVGAHYLIPDLNPPSALIKLFGDVRGYAWVFNRKRLSSVGVGIALKDARDWRERLTAFAKEQAPQVALPPVQSWILPFAADESAFAPILSGDNWCIIGDAAGHVNPMTGEGIVYAMRGGRLAAESIIKGDIKSFDAAWRKAYLERFLKALKLSRLLTKPRLIEFILMASRVRLVKKKVFASFNAS